MENHVFYGAYMHISIYFHGGIRVQVFKEFNITMSFPPVVIIKSLLVDLLLHFCR